MIAAVRAPIAFSLVPSRCVRLVCDFPQLAAASRHDVGDADAPRFRRGSPRETMTSCFGREANQYEVEDGLRSFC